MKSLYVVIGIVVIVAIAAVVLMAGKANKPASPAPTQNSSQSSSESSQNQASETGTASPITIMESEASADGCTLVELNTQNWGPISKGYTSGADPFFQLHDNEEGFYFNAELYTVYGPGWTGQTGTFALDCSKNGICVYLVPDDVNSYLANSGTVQIDSLLQQGGAITGPVDVTFQNASFYPAEGSKGQGCYHINEVQLSS